MPAAERIVNRMLSGTEVKELIRRDFEKLLANEGLLNDYVAYGRIAWAVNLRLQVANPMNPQQQSFLTSQAMAVPGSNPPEPTNVDNFPLDNPDDDTKHSSEIHRIVSSPNEERLRNGLSVFAEVKQPDGTISNQEIKYPEGTVEGEGHVDLKDTTDKMVPNWAKTEI